jgi:hypothetical protein
MPKVAPHKNYIAKNLKPERKKNVPRDDPNSIERRWQTIYRNMGVLVSAMQPGTTATLILHPPSSKPHVITTLDNPQDATAEVANSLKTGYNFLSVADPTVRIS